MPDSGAATISGGYFGLANPSSEVETKLATIKSGGSLRPKRMVRENRTVCGAVRPLRI
jgi:hypothetical protein